LAKDQLGQLKDPGNILIQATMDGPDSYEASVEKTSEIGIYHIVFPNCEHEGDYQMYVKVNGHLLYQWLVRLRNKHAHSGAAVLFTVSGPALGGGKAGVPTHLNIECKNPKGDLVDVVNGSLVLIVGGNLNDKKAKVVQQSTGKYKAEFTIDRAGPNGIDVRYLGTSINNPPPVATFYL